MKKSPTLRRKRWTAAELRKRPASRQDAVLARAAALAQHEYRSNPDLTAFEAYGRDDMPALSFRYLCLGNVC